MKKNIQIILLGCHPFAQTMACIHHVFNHQVESIIMLDKKQIEEIRNMPIKPEPFKFYDLKNEFLKPKFNDIPRNKFIDKPLNNYKKQ